MYIFILEQDNKISIAFHFERDYPAEYMFHQNCK